MKEDGELENDEDQVQKKFPEKIFSPIPILYGILIQATLAVDFDVGFAIKEKVNLFIAFFPFFKELSFQVIPRAVLYFTGDIFGSDDDEDFEDCEDEDDEDED